MFLRTLLAIFLALAFGGWNSSSMAIARQAEAAKAEAEKPKYRYWTTNWSFEDIDLGKLVSRLKTIGIDLPIKADGRASVEFKVSVPINALRTGKAYRINGSLNLRELVAGPVKFDRLDATVRYADGRLELQQLRGIQAGDPPPTAAEGTQPPPHLDGSATVELIPPGQFEAEVETNAFAAGPFAELLVELGFIAPDQSAQGRITSDVSLAAAVDDLSEPTKWSASGALRVDELRRSEKVALNLIAPSFQYKNYQLSMPELQIRSATNETFFLTSGVELGFRDNITFELTPRADDFPVTELLGWFIEDPESVFDGKLDLQGTAQGNFQTNGVVDSLDVQLAIASPEVQVVGVNLGTLEHDLRLTPNRISLNPRVSLDPESTETAIRSIEADYNIGTETIEVSDLDASIFGGQWTGNATIARGEQGTHTIDAQWNEIRPVIQLPVGAARPTLTLQSTGGVNWNVPADSIDKPAAHSGNIQASLQSILLGDQPVGGAELKLAVNEGDLDGELSGELFGGTVTVRSVASAEENLSWNDLLQRLQVTQFEFADLAVEQLIKLTGTDVDRFDGRLGGSVQPFMFGDQDSLQGEVELESFSIDDVPVSRTLALKLSLSDGSLVIQQGRGTYCGGQVQLDGRWYLGGFLDDEPDLAGGRVRLIAVRLTRADGERLFRPFTADAAQWFQGRVSARATITGLGRGIAESIRLSGAVDVRDAESFGIPIGDAHSPLSARWVAGRSYWGVHFPSIRSQLAGGTVRGFLDLQSAGGGRVGIHLRSGWRLNHVDFERLLTETIGTSTIGRGDLTGDFDLTGQHVQSVNDLRGQFQFRLGGTDATAVPGLSAAGSLLGASVLVGARFEQGYAIGRIDRGKLRLQDVSMTSDRLSVNARGTVGLVDRRLNVKAVIATGNFQGQNLLLRELGTQALLSATPIGQVNRILSDRTVVIELVGPTRDPILRLLPAETLQANARRFAVQEAMGLIIADSILLD